MALEQAQACSDATQTLVYAHELDRHGINRSDPPGVFAVIPSQPRLLGGILLDDIGEVRFGARSSM